MKRNNLIIISILGAVAVIALILILVFTLKPTDDIPTYKLVPGRYERDCFIKQVSPPRNVTNRFTAEPKIVVIRGDLEFNFATGQRLFLPLVQSQRELIVLDNGHRSVTRIIRTGKVVCKFHCVDIIITIEFFEVYTKVPIYFEISGPVKTKCKSDVVIRSQDFYENLYVESEVFDCKVDNIVDSKAFQIKWHNHHFNFFWRE